MEIGLSTYLFSSHRLSSHILDQMLNAGIRAMEIFATRRHLDYYDKNHVQDVAQWFLDHGLSLHSVHAPLFSGMGSGRAGELPLSPAYLERRLRIGSMDEMKHALEVAERLPFSFFILHLGLPGEEYDPRKFDAAFTSIEHLRLFAKERGAQILIENIHNDLSTPQRLINFLQYTRLDVKICFDTGHAHLSGGVVPEFDALKDVIATVHLHDNRRESDDHLMPFSGTIEWGPVLEALRSLNGQAPLLLEPRDCGPEQTGMAKVQEVIRKLREQGRGNSGS
jgi:sugar phosphate isomerase/epimerase